MNSAIDRCIFIMSLDCEQIWGVLHPLDSRRARIIRRDPTAGRGSIDILLRVFEKYNVPATWAMVGHLFLDHCVCEDGIPHKGMPRPGDGWLSEDPCTDIQKDPLFYGRDIVEKIAGSRVKHEIGLHSFSHVRFSECSRQVAEAEVREGVAAARRLGITVRSFVYPYNAVGHIDVLRSNGFEIYRSESMNGVKAGHGFLHGNVSRVTGRMSAPLVEPVWADGIWRIPTTAFFCDPVAPWLLLPKIKGAIRRAMESNGIVHVFLHPQDLLYHPSLRQRLDELMAFVSRFRDAGKLQVMTMGDLADYLNKGAGTR